MLLFNECFQDVAAAKILIDNSYYNQAMSLLSFVPEKALKAYLIELKGKPLDFFSIAENRKQFPDFFTHNISELLELCGIIKEVNKDKELSRVKEILMSVNYITQRYCIKPIDKYELIE